MADIRIRVVSDPGEFRALSGVWNRLLQESGDSGSIYLTHEWLSTWWKHYGEGKKLNIVLMEREREVIGIVPLMRVEHRIGLIKLHLLETIGSVNYNCIALIRPESSDGAVTALCQYLEDELSHNKLVVRLTFVPDDCNLLKLLLGYISQSSKRLVVYNRRTTLAPYITLPQNWKEYFDSLSRNRRWMLRRKLRDLREEHTVEFKKCTGDDLEPLLGKFVDLHQQRWRSVNVRGVFSDVRMQRFYKDIGEQFTRKGWLHFSYLALDGEMAAGEFGFVYGNRFYAATTARGIEYSAYGVGHLQHMFLIKEVIESNLQEFDFLKGDEPYKFYWTKSARKYRQIVIVNKGRCPDVRVKWLDSILRLQELSRYGLRESYHLYMIKKREQVERRRMGLEG